MIMKETIQKNGITAILLIHCTDRKGIIARVTSFINEHNGNIIYLEQHVDKQQDVFFMRVEWQLERFTIPRDNISVTFGEGIADEYDMHWRLFYSDQIPRMAVFVSKMSHCLYDILSRYQAGDWPVDIPLIISNHETLAPVAERFGIPFFLFRKNAGNKDETEALELKLLRENNIDFVVLARYMQILSGKFINAFPDKIINIHHSFLPAFPGAKPYHSAYERGVKIMGATSHYVTEQLDAGPIIAQDVTRISHTDSVNNLIRRGQDLEKIVLSRAVYAHINRKILVYNNRTIVFS
jgi:formyltetrahydrofolate deformylase